ncbi:MAG: cryptochrome/photolyase family protein [Hyphomicrobium sp.]
MPKNVTGDLILVLGDQLSRGLSSLRRADKSRDCVLMVEVADETTYVRHHKKKIAFILSAMRCFAAELKADGWRVDYVNLDDAGNSGSFTGEVERAAARVKPRHIVVTEPGEWRVLEMMRGWEAQFGVPVDILIDERFVASRAAFALWAKERKQLRMEYFYRDMRRQTGLLMDGDDPIGGKWNFDSENRKPAKRDLFMPAPPRFEPDPITRDVLELVASRFGDHIGALEPFLFAVTRKDALLALDHFIRHALPNFGDYQDAMLTGEPFLYHSVLSPYLNVGLLDPLEICRRAESAYKQGKAPLNAVEGFIRQIIGWREYVRGVYWLKMPGYVELNYFGATRRLPDFYWTGETKMACLKAAIGQTIEHAYAPHIQRLMITGNFAMLAGVDPRDVHEWYLMVYADAFEWVELPNTLGMSQFADGGLLGSKPYAAGGAYINKMSDYCGGCRFDVKQRTGPDGCPFNALYWNFLDRNRAKLAGNPRLAQAYATWDKMSADARREVTQSAEAFLTSLSGDPAPNPAPKRRRAPARRLGSGWNNT